MSDDSFNQPLHDPELIYLQTAERLIAQNQWQLLTAADLAALAAGEIQQARVEGREINILRCMRVIYSEALYLACSGGEGADRQDRGYTELFVYLLRVARRSAPDLGDEGAREAAQMALEDVFERFAQCRSPRSFCAFALSCLRTAITALRRQSKNNVSFDQMQGEDSSLAELLPDLRFDPSEEALRREQIDRLRQVIEDLLREHPRAADQFKAFLWKYRDDLPDEEIARRLGTTVPRVHVLRSRWLKKLRELLRDDDNSDGEHSS